MGHDSWMPKQPSTPRRSTGSRKVVGSRPRRDFAGMEQRRLKAAQLFEKGAAPAEVARALDVSCQSAVNWYSAWQRSGKDGLRGAGRAGRLPRLRAQQLADVEEVLLRGARAGGFATDLWTLQRVAQIIEKTTGVSYHQGHVWRILRAMGWSRQKPARRAVERDEEAIERWVKERWPVVKKTPGDDAPGLSSRTRAASHSSPRSAAPGHRAAAPPS